MAGKIKYIAALIIVISLIYLQHSSVSYAGEENRGRDAQTVREESNLAGKQGGEEKPPGEGEEKPPEEGEEKPPGEGEEKPPEEGEGKPPGEGEEKPPEEGEEKPPVEEERAIEKYKIEIPKVNGKKGYYTKKPQIIITHISAAGETKYCLRQGDEKLEEKTLKEEGERAVIAGKTFAEGRNVLHVWMEDENGEKIKQYELKKEFFIDTKAPEIQMSVPEGFDKWYQGKVTLSAAGADQGSGVVKISCREGNHDLGSINGRQGEFVLSRPSASGKGIDITVTAEDRAGNKSERIKTVFIDKNAPDILITGARNYMITGKSVKLSFSIDEENVLQEFYVQTEWENVKGKKRQIPSAEWRSEGTAKTLVQTLKNDGIYTVKVYAKDLSGNAAAKEFRIIIDKTNPVIRYVQELNGRQLKRFRWDYPIHQMIRDFTTYVYDMNIDGQLYHMGETVSIEGKHRMTVKVTDAAGNKAQVSADFTIDHTAPQIIFRNIEEEKEYEGERTFKVALAKKEDMIRQIRINGKEQQIDYRKKVYEYTLREQKDYEVTVKAADEAGNESVKSIFFQIVPKKSLPEKIAGPVNVRWSLGKKEDAQFFMEAGGKKEKGTTVTFEAVCLMLFGCGMIAAAVFFGRALHKKREKNG